MSGKDKDQVESSAPPAERRSRGRPQLRSDDETRAIIYEAARREFAARGFAAANIADVACRAGVSTKTLYRLVPTKFALFEGAVTERMDRFVSIVNLGACDGRDVAAALEGALMTCADLLLDAEVIAVQPLARWPDGSASSTGGEGSSSMTCTSPPACCSGCSSFNRSAT
jgi:AcrR family transcriptional regulator